MKLVVPYVDELLDLDARMIRLATFLGIPCETVALTKISERDERLSESLPDYCSCFAINPEVMKKWVGLEGLSTNLVNFLVSRFSNLLVYGVRAEDFDVNLVAALSMGKLSSIDAVGEKNLCYEFANDSRHVCEAFAGLSFGPANPNNDHVFCISSNDPAVECLISIGSRPFLAAIRLETTEILFLAGKDIADLDTEVGDAPLAEYFSRFLPHAMALRYMAGEDCWRPSKAHASVIIDDPLLRERYGFLDFESLLRLAEQHNFHTTIAFIPHNFRRNSIRITRMFQNNAERLSICFHGNDHTGREFASRDLPLLSTFVRVAEDRMNLHQEMTGLPCDRVMVFPQGNFSVEAMTVVKSHNFYAAVNRISHPAEQPIQLTIGDLAQPAVLRYGGFPLFGRKPIQQTESQDIAFNLFFGRPILIVEHHEIFQNPKLLVAIASKINALAPKIHWSNLATVVSNSILTRRTSDGTHHVRAYSGTVRISNDSTCTRRYSVEWSNAWNIESIEQVLLDGAPCNCLEADDIGFRVSVELAPASSKTFVLVHRSMPAAAKNLGLGWKARAFLRRRLSEIRDNYLSKNQRLLEAAKAFQRRFLKV